jgi:hypothetical protein
MADILACSQKVSHSEMRMVSAAICSSFPFSFLRTFGACWFLYVSTILWLTHRDCRILHCYCVLDVLNVHWTSVYLLVEGHERRLPQVRGRLIRTRKSLSLTGLEPRTSHWRQTFTLLALSISLLFSDNVYWYPKVQQNLWCAYQKKTLFWIIKLFFLKIIK